jgi:hypothetical protein
MEIYSKRNKMGWYSMKVRFIMRINKFFQSVCGILIILLTLAACAPKVGGIVQGAVYGDLNGNGTIDPGETVLSGAQVTLADCGPVQSQVTVADGLFDFTNLPAGTCHVSVTKAGWIFSGSYPALTYPVPVASDPNLPTSFSLFMAPVGGAVPTSTPVPSATPTPSATPVPIIATIATTPPVPLPTGTPVSGSSAPMVTPKTVAANCRFGPGTAFSAVGGLNPGVSVPILATISGQSWWQIQNPEDIPGKHCWVSAAVTIASGDLSLVPVIPIPTGLVTDLTVSVSPGPVVHGVCFGPNAVHFSVTMTTNGPANVTYHLEIYNGDNTLRNSPGDQTLAFASASSQTFDPGGAYKTDCGSYYIKVIVTNPNSISARADWSVVSP